MNVSKALDAHQISERVAELGGAISAAYAERSTTIVSILKGSFIFTSDLVRHVKVKDLQIDFMGVSSYGDSTDSSGVVRITHDLSKPIKDRHVLIVEDIVDTGLTLSFLMDQMRSRGAASVSVCALLSKPSRRRTEVQVDFLGFSIEDKFVVGYGLDYAENYRELPYIGVLSLI